MIRFVYEKRPDLASATLAAKTTEISRSRSNSRRAITGPTIARGDTCTTALANDVKERILALMVEKTGYPQDMLDVDLDLEADLGVDTVKQAEMFAAIREIYNIPRDENRKLRDYPTLAHVIRFVYEKRPDLASATPVAKTAEIPAAVPSLAATQLPTPLSPVTSPKDRAADDVKERILELMVEKTGYPKDMLDVDLDLEADLGVDTVKQAEMFAAIREIYNIPRDENRKLRDYPTLAHVIRFVYEKRPDLAGAASPSPITAEPPLPEPATCRRSQQSRTTRSKTKCWRSWPRRRAIPRTCWTWILTWKPTSASIPSSRRRCLPLFERRITSRAMRTSSCATSPPWPTSFNLPMPDSGQQR